MFIALYVITLVLFFYCGYKSFYCGFTNKIGILYLVTAPIILAMTTYGAASYNTVITKQYEKPMISYYNKDTGMLNFIDREDNKYRLPILEVPDRHAIVIEKSIVQNKFYCTKHQAKLETVYIPLEGKFYER